MRQWKRRGIAALVVLGLAGTAFGASVARPSASRTAAASSGCALSSPSSSIQHVVYLQFDNTHFRRDRSNVASDLEQMPHLLNFLQNNGTLFTNDHTILISHTAGGILSSLTGLYPDRQGQTVSNSYDYFDNGTFPQFTSSFKYWTDPVNAPNPANNPPLVGDSLPNMITDGQKNTPAPWVPYTRAGCDFGGVGTANIELENTGTTASGDMTKVFGTGSPEWTEAKTNSQLAQTDFVGIAIHCSQASSSKCAGNTNARADLLPDEPNANGTPGGGYTGYSALFGAKYVDPAITGGNTCVNDTAGNAVTDPKGNCGFPGFDGMLAKNTLGYVAQMQESGVPVTYAYISDAHDIHVPTTSSDSFVSHADGSGEAEYQAQLKAYDDAFAAFFSNLAAHGIDKSNTLFVVTVDEGDHMAGGIGTPQADGTLQYAQDANGIHTACAVLTACPTNQLGEITTNLKGILPANEPAFDLHFDDAPTIYLNGNPGRTDPNVRKLEHDIAALQEPDPYVRDAAGKVQTVNLTAAFADPVEEKALHMVNSDPSRTPTFTWFANPDYFFQASDPSYKATSTSPNQCAGVHLCASPAFAWDHGDIQEEIGNTWAGFVGPGVSSNGVDSTTWTDHTNLRPTIMALLGLHDDYTNDGRVLVEALTTKATPQALIAHRETVLRLGDAYEQVNASFGAFATETLKASTTAIQSTSDATYNGIEDQIASLTTERDALAGKIKAALNGAAFNDQALNEQQAKGWIDQANSLIDQATTLAGD